MADDLSELRSRIRLSDLVGQVVKLKKAGRNWTGLCPFHDDRNPSFSVNDETGRYRCWSCGEKGDIFNWVMKTQHVEFGEALRQLAASIGYTLKGGKSKEDVTQRDRYRDLNVAALEFFRTQLLKSADALGYLERRDLPREVADQWELGYAPDVDIALVTALQKQGHKLAEAKELFLVDQDPGGGFFDKFRGRLMFPIRDERGAIVAFGGRILGEGTPKYINSSDTPLFRKSRTLYGLFRAKEHLGKGQPAVLCEGYLDVIACHRAGVPSAVASLGTSLTEEHARLLARWTDTVVILYDADAAGEKAAVRAETMLRAEKLKVRVALMPPGEDPDTLLKTQGPAAVQAAVEAGLTPATFQIEMLLRKQNPSEPEFWQQAAEIVACAHDEMEAGGLLQRLAPRHPSLRDPKEAYQALRRMVVSVKRSRREGSPSRPAEAAKPGKLGIKAAERVLFEGFLSETFRITAWHAMKEDDLFLTHAAAELAQAIHAAFPEAAPAGPPRQWLADLPEAPQDFLAEIHDRSDGRLSLELVNDTLQRLRDARESRQITQLKTETEGDERLKALQERLSKLKGT